MVVYPLVCAYTRGCAHCAAVLAPSIRSTTELRVTRRRSIAGGLFCGCCAAAVSSGWCSGSISMPSAWLVGAELAVAPVPSPSFLPEGTEEAGGVSPCALGGDVASTCDSGGGVPGDEK